MYLGLRKEIIEKIQTAFETSLLGEKL